MTRGETPIKALPPSGRGRVLLWMGLALWVGGFCGGAKLGQASCGQYVWDRLHPMPAQPHGSLVGWDAFSRVVTSTSEPWDFQNVELLRPTKVLDRPGELPCRGPRCNGQSDLPAVGQVALFVVPDETRVGMTVVDWALVIVFWELPSRDWLVSERLGAAPSSAILKPPC
jgi:hypothetical protein